MDISSLGITGVAAITVDGCIGTFGSRPAFTLSSDFRI